MYFFKLFVYNIFTVFNLVPIKKKCENNFLNFLERYSYLLQPIDKESHKSFVQRSSSPVPLVNGLRTRSDSNISVSQGLAGHHILSVDGFNKEQLNDIFNLAQTFRACVHKKRSLSHILKV